MGIAYIAVQGNRFHSICETGFHSRPEQVSFIGTVLPCIVRGQCNGK
jgi:hypothetical protein